MKKNILVLLFTTVFINFAKAQNWDSVGSRINCCWVSALAVYNGELYAGGYFTRAGGIPVNDIAKWNGTSWSVAGAGINYGVHNSIKALVVYNGNLYAAGEFDSAGGVPASNIALWNGTTWSAVGNGITGISSFVQTLCVYNGSLCAGGVFDSAGGNPASNIALWNGTAWSALGSGVKGTGNYTGGVYSLAAYDSVLFAGGDFDTAGNNPASFIAQWNGSTWSAVGTGLSQYIISWVTCSAIYNRSLYIGGYFDTAGGMPVNYIARWNGTSWDSVLSGVAPYFNVLECMTVSNGNLYVGGGITSAGGVRANNVAVWNGANWDSVGSGFQDTGVNALCEYNGQLYAGGIFLNSGSTITQHIARFDKSAGINPIASIANSIYLYPNPNNGQFTLQMKGSNLKTDNDKAYIEIYNLFGEKVYSATLLAGQTNKTIDICSQPAEMFLYRVIGESGELIGEGKVLIQK